jgi:hypothetical protein
MNRPAILLGFASVLLLVEASVRAGFDPPKRIEKSAAQERIATHIVVGELIAYRQIGGSETSPGRDSLNRYEAEIRVETVEKGRVIAPRDRITVRFSSHYTAEQLAHHRFLFGCAPEYKLEPFPGETTRVYLTMNAREGFVADHPDSFFSIGNFRDSEGRPIRSEAPRSNTLAVSMVAVISVLGVAIPLAVVQRRRRLLRRVKIVPASDSMGPLCDFLRSGHNGEP